MQLKLGSPDVLVTAHDPAAMLSISLFSMPFDMQVHTFNIGIYPGAILPFIIGYWADAATAVGDITATEEASGIEQIGPRHDERIQGCLLADGMPSHFCACCKRPLCCFLLFAPTFMHAQCTVGPRSQAKPCAGSTSVSYCWCLKLLALMHRFQLFPGQLCHFTTGECVCPEQWYHCLHPVCLAYGGRGHCHLAVPVWSPWKGDTTAQGS